MLPVATHDRTAVTWHFSDLVVLTLIVFFNLTLFKMEPCPCKLVSHPYCLLRKISILSNLLDDMPKFAYFVLKVTGYYIVLEQWK